MKRFFTLLIGLIAIVGTAGATKRVWLNLTDSDPDWTKDNSVTAIYYSGSWDDAPLMNITYMYGKKWCYYDVPDNITSVNFKRCGGNPVSYWNSQSNNCELGNDESQYFKIQNNNTSDYWQYYNTDNIDAPSWNNLVFRQNIIDWQGNNGTTWNDNDMHNTTRPDGDTFVFTLTKSQIDASSNKEQGIRFRLRNSDYITYNDAGTEIKGYPQIYPTSSDATLNIAGNTTTYYHNTDNTSWFWQVNIPDYDYEKIVLTAKYVNDNGYKWKISADAYITVSVSNAGYATFSYACPLDLSEVTEFDTYVASGIDDVNGSKYVHMTKITSAVPESTGLLLVKEGGCTNVEVPVAASADAPTNLLVATVTEQQVSASTSSSHHYFLANGANGIGFYNLASAATSGANKAYLNTGATELTTVNGNHSSRVAWIFDDSGTTDIHTIDRSPLSIDNAAPIYNIAGQRVANDYKGIVIQNGKKFINK